MERSTGSSYGPDPPSRLEPDRAGWHDAGWHDQVQRLKPREIRRALLLPARMRDAAGWRDITICNVSPRGLMGRTPSPPQRGAFIEVRRNHACIVGQVRWVQGGEFGLRTQDRIDIAALCGPSSQKPKDVEPADIERRSAVRREAPRSLEEAAERSRNFARLFDRAIIVGGVLVAAIVLSQEVGSILADPLGKASQALHSAQDQP